MSMRKTTGRGVLEDEQVEIVLRVHPISRQERRIQQNRDLMEKDRVSNRVENFERHDVAQVTGDAYDEHNRFGDNFEEMERQRKRNQRLAKQEYLQNMGALQVERENYYKNCEVEKDQRYDAGIQMRGSKKNVSGEPFNIITREYHNNELKAGIEAQAEKDYRDSLARKELLAKRSGLGYNLLTGEEYAWRK